MSYFSARNLLTTMGGGGPVLDGLQCEAQKPLVMMVSLAVAAELGLTQPVQQDRSCRGLSPLTPVTPQSGVALSHLRFRR